MYSNLAVILQWIAFPRPYRFELLEGSAKQVSDRRGRRKQRETGPLNPVFYKGDNFGPTKKNPNWYRN